ncbi:MAG TPA: hypothetical protein GX736_04825 [Mogibacterium sp.]|nr:hypothetical protein [Mogibacterium sp.]
MSFYALGIDTSNYKTSIAVTDNNGEIIFERSVFLDIPLGEKGLRQSDAFFKHSNLLPCFIQELFNRFNPSDLSCIGVSSRPRNIEGSYMPCFLAGVNTGKQLGAILKIPVYEFSHQEGHAAAILEDNSFVQSNLNKCILFHLSGGTSEFLICSRIPAGYDMSLVGGTKDISIGQLIDRVGVALGLPFPAGKYLDEIAYIDNDELLNLKENNHLSLNLDIFFSDGYFNLSGIETKIMRLIQNSDIDITERKFIITSMFDSISKLIHKSTTYLSKQHDIKDVAIVGGVAASKYLRKKLTSVNNNNIVNIFFGSATLSSDNAVGIARLAQRLNRRTDETDNCLTIQ